MPLIQHAVSDGYDSAVMFSWFPGCNNIIKRHGGRFVHDSKSQWHKYWRFPLTKLEDVSAELYDDLIEASSPHGVGEDWTDFASMIQHARKHPMNGAFITELKASIYPLKDKSGASAIFSSYHPLIISICKKMRGKFLPTMKAWMVPGSAEVLLNNLISEGGMGTEQIELMPGEYAVVEDAFYKAKAKDAITISMPDSAVILGGERKGEDDDNIEDGVFLAVTEPLQPSALAGNPLDGILSKYELRDYQRPGVTHLVSNTSALLADDMGLGKTRQAVVAADILMSYGNSQTSRSIVACPASLTLNWFNEIKMVDPKAKISLKGWDPEARWVVSNYDNLNAIVPYAGAFKVMITDEAHLLKEPTIMRTRTAFEVAAHVPYRFLLTGTPILNREAEIHTLLKLSGHPIGNMPIKEFTKRFGGDSAFRRDLNSRISEWMLRRRKEHTLSLKGKQRQKLHLRLAPHLLEEYYQVANSKTLTPLTKIGRLRVLLERAKVPSILEMIGELSGNDKFIIFCEFKETVSFLKQELERIGIDSVSLTGDDSVGKRQKAVDRFQTDPNIGGFLGTTLAAGVGITLTAANYVFFVSLPWTAALKNQAEDRAYRLGQERVVFVKIPLVDGTIDSYLWDMLEYKHGLASDIVSPEEEDDAMQAFAIEWSSKADTYETNLGLEAA
jgi:hypothetical protein